MIRRELLGALSVTAAGLVGAIGRIARADQDEHHGEVHERCLKHCQGLPRLRGVLPRDGQVPGRPSRLNHGRDSTGSFGC
jgi:hypothetical protein